MVKKTHPHQINPSDRAATSKEFIKLEESFKLSEEKYKRVLADYQNQERRHQELSSSLVKMAASSLLEKLLLNFDNLLMAQSHLKDQGLQIVIDQFRATFTTEGLSEINTDGQVFDPLTMDCLEIVPGDKDQVTETVAPGYFLFDKVLRPAKVKVGSGTTPEM